MVQISSPIVQTKQGRCESPLSQGQIHENTLAMADHLSQIPKYPKYCPTLLDMSQPLIFRGNQDAAARTGKYMT